VLRAALLAPALAALAWQTNAPLPVARTEVAAARHGDAIVVVGGYLADGSTTARADVYVPSSDTWRRAPDLPVAVNHGAAVTLGGRAVVAGGYTDPGGPSRGVYRLEDGRWSSLPRLPFRRAAAGAAALGGTLYVVGGVGPAGLARNALAYARGRWRAIPGPTPREHLAVAASGGRLYAIAGRTAGFDTNLALVESWRPGERRWRREPSVPEPRGGTGAAAVGTTIVSAGGEAVSGTLGKVFGFDVRARRWTPLPDLPTPRHGLGVVSVGSTVYVLGGGPQPGLHVSAANESLALP
jgi:non-specific serine/threonine protein kinase